MLPFFHSLSITLVRTGFSTCRTPTYCRGEREDADETPHHSLATAQVSLLLLSLLGRWALLIEGGESGGGNIYLKYIG